MTMTSRERVRAVFEHREPDRVPIDMGSIGATGISVHAYRNLCRHLGVDCSCRTFDPVLQLAIPEEHILERFHVDLKAILPKPDKWREKEIDDSIVCSVPDSWKPVAMPDGSEVVYEGDVVLFKRPYRGYYFDHVFWPLSDATIDDLDDFVWPAPFSFYKLPDEDRLDMYLQGLEEEARYWHDNSEYALVGNFGGSIYEAATGLMGYEKFLTDIIQNRAFVEKLFDKLVESNIEYAKRYLDLVADYIDVIMVGGEDIGMQGGLEINPHLYREIVKPRQKKLWKFIKNSCDAYLVVHCCGSMSDIIEDFIEIGVDAINPVQVSARNMDSGALKERYGDRITFWGGGCDTQRILPFGTPEDVEEEVKRRITDFAPRGGFIFSQVHTIQADVRPENIVSLFDTAFKYGAYPVKTTGST
jgi:uroporphyrinogen decarboxylase